MKNYKNCKAVIFGIILLTAVLYTVSCSPKAVRQKKKKYDISLAKILLKKEFVIGLESNAPPFCQINVFSQTFIGYDIDVITELCSRLGVKPVFKDINFAQKDVLLKTGEIDCIWSCFSYTPDRAKTYTLSIPYIRTATIVTVMDNSPYTTLEDLKDKKIGVQSGTIMRAALENMASKYGSMPAIVSFPTTYDALLALEHGEIDGVVHDILIVNSLITNSQRPYRVIPDALLSDEYVVAFRLGDTALKNAIELVFNDMAKTDFFEATSKKWFGSNISLIGH